MKISEEQRDDYKAQLQRDSGKDFGSEFVRTTDLEMRIIAEHGFEGVRLVFEDLNSENYFELGEFPSDCPWAALNGESLGGFIDANFKPLEDYIYNIPSVMKQRCRFIYAERTQSEWLLHYLLRMTLYDGREYFTVYKGGAPNPNPEPNENLKTYGWTIPPELARLYAVHDGFGELYDANYVMGSQDIKVLAEMMNPISEKQDNYPEDYKFEDLLEFFPDGAGNAQCFYRNGGNSNILTVDWDHETWELGRPISFYEFIDERMSELDEE